MRLTATIEYSFAAGEAVGFTAPEGHWPNHAEAPNQCASIVKAVYIIRLVIGMATAARSRYDEHTKTIMVPCLGEVVFQMRRGDRRNGIGTARVEPSDHVRDGFGIVKGYGARRSILVWWVDADGGYHLWSDGPQIGLRGRASGRYGTLDDSRS